MTPTELNPLETARKQIYVVKRWTTNVMYQMQEKWMEALGNVTVTQNVLKWETVVPIFKAIVKVSVHPASTYIFTLSTYNLSLVTRKPDFGVCDQGRLEPTCLAEGFVLVSDLYSFKTGVSKINHVHSLKAILFLICF